MARHSEFRAAEMVAKAQYGRWHSQAWQGGPWTEKVLHSFISGVGDSIEWQEIRRPQAA